MTARLNALFTSGPVYDSRLSPVVLAFRSISVPRVSQNILGELIRKYAVSFSHKL